MGRTKYETMRWRKLKAMHAEHPEYNVKEMSEALHIDKSDLYSIMKCHNWEIDLRTRVNNPRMTDEEKDLAVQLYFDGKTMHEIGDYIGVGYGVIRWLLHTRGIKRKGTNVRLLQRNLKIARLSAMGWRNKKIALEMSLTVGQLEMIKRRIRGDKTGWSWWELYHDLLDKKKSFDNKIKKLKEHD